MQSQDTITQFFRAQLAEWPQAGTSYQNLNKVRVKTFSFGDYEVRVQFNPARIVSSGAKVDAKTISERKCFLCANHRPGEQRALDYGDYEILVNPFPIFPEHFTIARKAHVPQEIKPYFADMLELARHMNNYVVFYNGPRCGASAPDHMHFQAGTKDFLPLIQEYHILKDSNTDLLVSSEHMQLYQLKSYGRTVYVIESTLIEAAKDSFDKLYQHFSYLTLEEQEEQEGIEPMMNIVCNYESDKWLIYILPRKSFRPWQYTANGDEQLLVSPATVEMTGVFITPIEAHFEQITHKDIEDILQQVSL